MPRRTKYLIAGGISILAASALLLLWMVYPSATEIPAIDGVRVEFTQMPSGRILNIVVEEDGAYIGKEFIPFPLFDKYLTEHRAMWRANYVIVGGTEYARYGAAVRVYDAVRNVLRVPSSIETRALPSGTRRDAIEIRRNSY